MYERKLPRVRLEDGTLGVPADARRLSRTNGLRDLAGAGFVARSLARVREDEVVPPLFVFCDDVYSFDSVEAMVRYIEPIDMAEATGAFDSNVASSAPPLSTTRPPARVHSSHRT
jgi:hypothetical protein